MANRIATDAAKLQGDVEGVLLGVTMLAAAFSNGEVIANVELLRNQVACLQIKAQETKRQADRVVAVVTMHNALHH